MHRKKILFLLLSTLFLFSCGRKNKTIDANPDKPKIEEVKKEKQKSWWQFWSKKSKKINKDDESNINPLIPGNETINENIDIILSDLNSKINSLKAELNYYHEDLNEVKIQSKIYTNPFAVYNKEIVLENGTSIFGKIIYQDQDILKVETLIGQLIIERNTIVRVINQVSSYNKFNDSGSDISDAQNDSSVISGNKLINKKSQTQTAHLVLIGEILESKDNSGNTVLSGEVKNIGNKRADFSKIVFNFRMNWQGDTKNLVQFIDGVTNTFTTGFSSDNSILPHAIGNFSIIIPKSFGTFIGYDYELEWDHDYNYDIEWEQYEK
tara:strand:- start:125 stop:1093 length:969 start_codon:yes stop_codon:yes gene_type:complete